MKDLNYTSSEMKTVIDNSKLISDNEVITKLNIFISFSTTFYKLFWLRRKKLLNTSIPSSVKIASGWNCTP